ncbi:MAG: septum formation initiator family protein [Parcubacteria group bacterium]
MKELQQRQKLKRRIYSTPVLIALACLVVIFARGTYQVFQKRGESVDHVSSLEQKVRDLEEKERRLSSGIAALNTPEGIEREVKEKFNVSKEGEYVVILVDQNTSTTTDDREGTPWYKRLWNAIIDRN